MYKAIGFESVEKLDDWLMTCFTKNINIKIEHYQVTSGGGRHWHYIIYLEPK